MHGHANDPNRMFQTPDFQVDHANIPVPGREFFIQWYLKEDLNFYLRLDHPHHWIELFPLHAVVRYTQMEG